MPLHYDVDTERKLILTRGTGVLSLAEFIDHRWCIRAEPMEIQLFDEIFDVSDVERFDVDPGLQVKEIASFSAAMDPAEPTFMALVAPQPVAFGLARMYQSYRAILPNSTKQVAVFHTFAEALAWITKQRELRTAQTASGHSLPRIASTGSPL